MIPRAFFESAGAFFSKKPQTVYSFSFDLFDKLEFDNLMSCDSACDFSPIHNGYGRVNALLYENELSRRACV